MFLNIKYSFRDNEKIKRHLSAIPNSSFDWAGVLAGEPVFLGQITRIFQSSASWQIELAMCLVFFFSQKITATQGRGHTPQLLIFMPGQPSFKISPCCHKHIFHCSALPISHLPSHQPLCLLHNLKKIAKQSHIFYKWKTASKPMKCGLTVYLFYKAYKIVILDY